MPDSLTNFLTELDTAVENHTRILIEVMVRELKITGDASVITDTAKEKILQCLMSQYENGRRRGISDEKIRAQQERFDTIVGKLNKK